ncbi:MAG: hypothetical protein O0Y03_06175, partial [Methanocorpusculum sp.]|nr:hypothetical protein [Methanocorpusculum sp.]
RDGERRKANATSEAAARSDASALSAFSFFILPTHHSPANSFQKKTTKYFRHISYAETIQPFGTKPGQPVRTQSHGRKSLIE